MKPSTYTETVKIVNAYIEGRIKTFIIIEKMSYECAMQRVCRFRRQYPIEYQRISKCQDLSMDKK
jgi:hypothetical protein